jgi:hypothetical protein
MKNNIPPFDQIVPIIRRLRGGLVSGSMIGAEATAKAARWAFAAYPFLPPLAKAGVHIVVCITFLWAVAESGQPSPTSKAAAGRTPVPESAGTPVAEAARVILIEAQRRQELELAEAQGIHAEQQHRLAAEEAAAKREREVHHEQARYLQQLERQQQQAARHYLHEAQQNASEQANRDMQRYRRQMTGRPGF